MYIGDSAWGSSQTAVPTIDLLNLFSESFLALCVRKKKMWTKSSLSTHHTLLFLPAQEPHTQPVEADFRKKSFKLFTLNKKEHVSRTRIFFLHKARYSFIYLSHLSWKWQIKFSLLGQIRHGLGQNQQNQWKCSVLQNLAELNRNPLVSHGEAQTYH